MSDLPHLRSDVLRIRTMRNNALAAARRLNALGRFADRDAKLDKAHHLLTQLIDAKAVATSVPRRSQ